MGNIESKLCEWSDSFAKPVVESIEEKIKAFFKISTTNSVTNSIPNSVTNSIPNSVTNKEIVIKCSLEEMMKVFFKDYVIIWHDPNAHSQENQQYIAQLTRFCEVFTFTEWKKVKDYVRSTQAVCHIVTSGTNGELLVQEVFESENVSNIYVFCGNREYHSSWAQKYYQKISCVETDIQSLLYQIQQNLLEWYKKASSLNFNLPAFAPIFNDSDKSEMNHLHRYLKIIPNFKNRQQAKEDFVNLSKVIYTDLNNQRLIADFENSYNEYQKDHTLRWYTKESFLYKVTNNCLRIATSDSIQYCRLLLKDIERAIKEQYQTKSKSFNGLLFRGAYLSQEEWSSLKDNQDKEIEMHGFLSVSKEKNVALGFMETDPSKKVFITIIVPKGPNEEEQGFAEIEEYSQFPEEKEILFNVRSRFTVLETQDLPHRHLVLLYGAQGFRKFITDQNPVQEVPITNIESVSCAHCNAKSEGTFFVSIADTKQQSYYCKACIDYGVGPFLCIPKAMDKPQTSSITKIPGCFLTMNSSQHQTPFYGYKCCNCQAKKCKSYFVCTDCSQTKKWCRNCFDNTTLDCLEAGHSVLLETNPYTFWCEKMSQNELNHLKFQNDSVQKSDELFQQAEMYFQSHEYEKAKEYYSLYIQQNEAKGRDINLATSYHNIGLVYSKKGEYKEALEYYLKCLEIEKSLYGGDNHLSMTGTFSSIALVYSRQGEYKKALEYNFKSLNIRQSLDKNNHPDIAASFSNIGTIYYKQGDYNKALEYYSKSLEIQRSFYGGDNHPDVAASFLLLGNVYYYQGEPNKTLEYHLKCLNIYKTIYGENHPDTAMSYNNIGSFYDNQEEYDKALEYHLKSLGIRKSIYGENHPDTATSYHNIGLAYENQGEPNKALEYYFKSLDIRKSVYGGEDHSDIALSYNNIGVLYKDVEEYDQALEYLLKALEIRRSVYGRDDHPEIATSYNNIAGVYEDQGKYKKALEHYLKCLEIENLLYGSSKNPNIAISYKNIARLYKNRGEYDKALEFYLKSLDIIKSVFGENHPKTVQIQEKIQEIQFIKRNKL